MRSLWILQRLALALQDIKPVQQALALALIFQRSPLACFIAEIVRFQELPDVAIKAHLKPRQ